MCLKGSYISTYSTTGTPKCPYDFRWIDSGIVCKFSGKSGSGWWKMLIFQYCIIPDLAIPIYRWNSLKFQYIVQKIEPNRLHKIRDIRDEKDWLSTYHVMPGIMFGRYYKDLHTCMENRHFASLINRLRFSDLQQWPGVFPGRKNTGEAASRTGPAQANFFLRTEEMSLGCEQSPLIEHDGALIAGWWLNMLATLVPSICMHLSDFFSWLISVHRGISRYIFEHFGPPDLKSEESLLLLMEEILHQLIGSSSHYVQGFLHPRWCRISSINSIDPKFQMVPFQHEDFQSESSVLWFSIGRFRVARQSPEKNLYSKMDDCVIMFGSD